MAEVTYSASPPASRHGHCSSMGGFSAQHRYVGVSRNGISLARVTVDPKVVSSNRFALVLSILVVLPESFQAAQH